MAAKSLFHDASQAELRARLSRLDAATPARWGTMACPRMLAHVADALRMATGELPVPARRVPLLRNPLVRHLILYWLRFPKGAPTAPQLVKRAPESCDAEIRAVDALLTRFVDRPVGEPLPEHPAFGRLSREQWGVLGYKHMDHHLRQFGV